MRVHQSAWADWATAFSKVSKNLNDACELPTDDPLRTKHTLQAAKWYSALPQLILREPSRSPEASVKIIKLRLHQFLTGNYTDLVGHWVKDVRKQRARIRRPRSETSYQRVKRAVDLILRGDIARGLRLTDSHGVAPHDDSAVHTQMRDKHPLPIGPTLWPDLPEGWVGKAAEVDLSMLLKRVAREADDRAGPPQSKRPLHSGARIGV